MSCEPSLQTFVDLEFSDEESMGVKRKTEGLLSTRCKDPSAERISAALKRRLPKDGPLQTDEKISRRKKEADFSWLRYQINLVLL